MLTVKKWNWIGTLIKKSRIFKPLKNIVRKGRFIEWLQVKNLSVWGELKKKRGKNFVLWRIEKLEQKKICFQNQRRKWFEIGVNHLKFAI